MIKIAENNWFLKENEFKSWLNKEDYKIESKLDNGKIIMVFVNLKGDKIDSLGHFWFLYDKTKEKVFVELLTN